MQHSPHASGACILLSTRAQDWPSHPTHPSQAALADFDPCCRAQLWNTMYWGKCPTVHHRNSPQQQPHISWALQTQPVRTTGTVTLGNFSSQGSSIRFCDSARQACAACSQRPWYDPAGRLDSRAQILSRPLQPLWGAMAPPGYKSHAVYSPTAMPKPNRLFLLKWSISADRMKLTPTFTRSSRYAPTLPSVSMRPLNRHCRKM